MKTRCGSVGIHEHYLQNLDVSTTQLFRLSTDASGVYLTTECAAADLRLVLFVCSNNCIQIGFSIVNGWNVELEEAAD